MKNRSLFYRVYFIGIGVFLILLAVGLAVFYGWLGSYEAAQPAGTAESVVNTYLNTDRFAAFCKVCDVTVSPYETEQRITDFLSRDGKLTAVSTNRDPAGHDICFAVKAGDQKKMYLYLDRGEADRFGNRPYRLKEAAFPEEAWHTVTLSMPKSAVVTVNGVLLKDADRVDAALPAIPEAYFPPDMDNRQTALLTGLMSEDADVAATVDGVAVTVKKDGSHYAVLQSPDAEQQNAVETFAVEAAEAYAAHMQNDVTLTDAAKYLDKTTDFYKNFRATPVEFAWDHDSYSFKNVETSEYYRYGDSLFCCRVRFDQVLKLRSKKYVDHFDKLIFVVKNGGSLKVVDMQNIGKAE